MKATLAMMRALKIPAVLKMHLWVHIIGGTAAVEMEATHGSLLHYVPTVSYFRLW